MSEKFYNDQGLDYGALPPPEPSQGPLILAFTKGIETFALAHEIAHLVLNHGAGQLQAVSNSGCGQTARPSERSVQNGWLEEIEADALAQRIMNEIARQHESDPSENVLVRATLNYAPSFYFLLSEIRHVAGHALRSGAEPPGTTPEEEAALATILTCLDREDCNLRATLLDRHRSIALLPRHPHPTIRRRVAQHLASRRALTEEGRNMLAIANALYRNTVLMWEDMRPRLGEMYQAGIRIPACDVR